jgi:hypothetical protein
MALIDISINTGSSFPARYTCHLSLAGTQQCGMREALNLEDLRGRRIAVSGVTSGIGKSLLLELVESGATVAAMGRGLSRIGLTPEHDVVLSEVDMRDPYAVAGAVEEAATQMGGFALAAWEKPSQPIG